MTISLLENLTTIPEVELIYSNIKEKKDTKYIDYTIVFDAPSVTANIELTKNIIATMELIKILLKNDSNKINYTLKTSKSLTEELEEKNPTTVGKLTNSEIIYSKNILFENKIESLQSKKNKTK